MYMLACSLGQLLYPTNSSNYRTTKFRKKTYLKTEVTAVDINLVCIKDLIVYLIKAEIIKTYISIGLYF